MKTRYFAVSLVYYRWTVPPKFIVDEEGMPIGIMSPIFEMTCVTGTTTALTGGDAINQIRYLNNNKYQGWIEQMTHVLEIDMTGWWKWTKGIAQFQIKYFIWRIRRWLTGC